MKFCRLRLSCLCRGNKVSKRPARPPQAAVAAAEGRVSARPGAACSKARGSHANNTETVAHLCRGLMRKKNKEIERNEKEAVD